MGRRETTDLAEDAAIRDGGEKRRIAPRTPTIREGGER
jgi:hypothetical protein